METVNETAIFLLRPFFIGLYIGLFFCLVIFIFEKFQVRKLNKEIQKLKEYIQTKLEIEAELNEKKKEEIDDLKRQNENLRITLQSYYEKPRRKEIRQLLMYQKAIEVLTEKAPGFAQSWQSALKDGREEIGRIERGIIPFMKRLLPGKSHTSSSDKDYSVK